MRPEIQNDVQLLSSLKNFIEEINKENGVTYKKGVIGNLVDDGIKTVFIYTYSNQLIFNVTSKNVEKLRKPVEELDVPDKLYTLFNLLDDLSNRVITGHKALNDINYYISLVGEEFRDTIYRVLDKDLKTRAGVKLINSVFPNLINNFTVALGEAEKNVRNLNYFKDRWYSSRKMDGLRGVCVIDSLGSVTIYSREGKEIHTLENLKAEIRKLGLINYVLDGEICIIDDNGNENFNQVQKEWNRKNHQIANPKLCVFDFIPLSVFQQGFSEKLIFSSRQAELENTLSKNKESWEGIVVREENWDRNSKASIIILEQVLVISPEQLDSLKAKSVEKNWEGLIFRKDSEYIGDRSSDIVKHKLMEDAEFLVIDVEKGLFRVVNKQEDGSTLEEEEITLTNIVIEYEGERVSVGSGFTLEQRRHWYLHPDEIIGTRPTIQFFQKSVNKEGRPSLRFPIFKGIRTDK